MAVKRVKELQARSVVFMFVSDGSNTRTSLYLGMCTGGHRQPATGYAATVCWYCTVPRLCRSAGSYHRCLGRVALRADVLIP